MKYLFWDFGRQSSKEATIGERNQFSPRSVFVLLDRNVAPALSVSVSNFQFFQFSLNECRRNHGHSCELSILHLHHVNSNSFAGVSHPDSTSNFLEGFRGFLAWHPSRTRHECVLRFTKSERNQLRIEKDSIPFHHSNKNRLLTPSPPITVCRTQ